MQNCVSAWALSVCETRVSPVVTRSQQIFFVFTNPGFLHSLKLFIGTDVVRPGHVTPTCTFSMLSTYLRYFLLSDSRDNANQPKKVGTSLFKINKTAVSKTKSMK